jgi:uncharacterized membrane protein YphA (DoxX/SURF4 family)
MSTTKKNVLILVVRLIIGGIFIASGWMKVSAITQTVEMFATMGIPVFLTYVVSYAELAGGALIALGLWAELAAIVLAIIMVVAVYLTRTAGFAVFSMPLATLGGLLAIIATGAGRYALDSKLRSRRDDLSGPRN